MTPNVQMSPTLGKLAEALAKAQGSFKPVSKSGYNSFYKSSYILLDDLIETIKIPLSQNGLSIIQAPINEDMKVGVTTILLHSSGEWISSSISMSPKDKTPQADGSAITYARRYSLASMLNLASEIDDDGHSSSGHKEPLTQQKPPQMILGPHLFTGTQEQKLQLYKIFQKLNVTDTNKMRSCTEMLLGLKIKMIELEDAVKEAIDADQ